MSRIIAINFVFLGSLIALTFLLACDGEENNAFEKLSLEDQLDPDRIKSHGGFYCGGSGPVYFKSDEA